MMKNKEIFNHTLTHFALIGVLSLAAVGMALYYGLPAGNDLRQHYQFSFSVHRAIGNADIFPQGADLPNNGVGDYGIRFYPPLSYLALSLLVSVLGSWYAASLAFVFFVFFSGGIAVYLWAREGFPPPQSLLAAGIFIFAPYHLNQIYNNFLFAEFFASAVIPFCFLFLHRAAKSGKSADLAGLSIAYSLLILSHLPSLIIGSIALALYGVIVVIKSREGLRRVALLAAGVAGSVAATSFYWIRLVTELKWINHSSAAYFSQTYDYSVNFLLRPGNFLYFTEDVLSLWLGDLMLLAMIAVGLPSILLFARNRGKVPALLTGALAVALLAVFMASVASKPVWDIASPLQMVQFPWRWLGILSPAVSVAASYGIWNYSERMRESNSALLAAGIGLPLALFVFVGFFVTKQAVFIPASEFTNADVARIGAAPSFECWWTVWAKRGFYRSRDGRVFGGARDVKVLSWTPYSKVFKVADGPPGGIEANLLYYPYWMAESGSGSLAVTPTGEGLTEVHIPSGVQTVRLEFREPWFYRLFGYLSLAGWIFLGAIFLTTLARYRYPFFRGS